jgi:SNF2 family DNA or RNA helicase
MAWADIEPGTSPPVLVISCDPAENELAKKIPGCRYSKEDRLWRAPLSWPALGCLGTVWRHQPIRKYPGLAEWEDLKLSETGRRIADRYAEDASPELQVFLAEAVEKPGGPYLTPPQRGSVEWLATWRRAGLLDVPGTGKTPPLIRALQCLAVSQQAFPALVICPDSAPRSWARKIAVWAPEIRVAIASGSKTRREKAIELARSGDADVLIMTWGNLRLHTRLGLYPGQAYVRCNDCGGVQGKSVALCEVHAKELNEVREDGEVTTWLRTVIADEAHRAADPTSKQCRAMWFLAHHCENFWPATGTPIVNNIGDLWSILHAIDPLAWPVKSKFLDLFAVTGFAWMNKGKEVLDIRADTADALHWLIDPLFRQVPEVVARAGQPLLAGPEFRYPDLTAGQHRAYTAFKRQGLTEVEDAGSGATTEVVPDNTAVRYVRMHQLSSAMIEVRDGEDGLGFSEDRVRLCMPSNKVTDLVDFLADEAGPWIVTSSSLQLIDLAAAALGDPKVDVSHTRITGGMSGEAKDTAAVAFNNGEYRVIFLTPGAGGEAIDLDRADGVLWLDPPSSWVERTQVNGRADRFGRRTHARQVYMISPGTVETRLYELSLDRQAGNAKLTLTPAMAAWLMAAEDDEIVTREGDDQDDYVPDRD